MRYIPPCPDPHLYPGFPYILCESVTKGCKLGGVSSRIIIFPISPEWLEMGFCPHLRLL